MQLIKRISHIHHRTCINNNRKWYPCFSPWKILILSLLCQCYAWYPTCLTKRFHSHMKRIAPKKKRIGKSDINSWGFFVGYMIPTHFRLIPSIANSTYNFPDSRHNHWVCTKNMYKHRDDLYHLTKSLYVLSSTSEY